MEKECKGSLRSCLFQIDGSACWTKFLPPLEKHGKDRMVLVGNGIRAVSSQVSKIEELAKKRGYQDILEILNEELSWNSREK